MTNQSVEVGSLQGRERGLRLGHGGRKAEGGSDARSSLEAGRERRRLTRGEQFSARENPRGEETKSRKKKKTE